MSRTNFNSNFQQQKLSNFATPAFLPTFPTFVPPIASGYNPYLAEFPVRNQQPVAQKYPYELLQCNSNTYPLKMRHGGGGATNAMRHMIPLSECYSSLRAPYSNNVISTPYSVVPISPLYKNQSASLLYLNKPFASPYASPRTPLVYQNCDTYFPSCHNQKYVLNTDTIERNHNYNLAEFSSFNGRNTQRNYRPVDAVVSNSSKRFGSHSPAKSYISNAKTNTNLGEAINNVQRNNSRATSVPAPSATQSKLSEKLKTNCNNITSNTGLKSESREEFIDGNKAEEINDEEKDESLAEGVVKAVLKLNKTNECTNEVDFREIFIVTINEDPDVFIMPNFLTSDECQELLEMSKNRWERSKTSKGKMCGVSNDYVSGESEIRTSYSAFLKKGETSLVKMIENRVAAVAKVSPDYVESLVVIKYEEEQYFKEHHDGDFRISTVLIYLNDVDDGGETYFPYLGIKIRPEKGTAVYWRNIDEEGKADMRLLHSGLPPLKDVKYAVNCFINKFPVRFAEEEEEKVDNECKDEMRL